jgi:hypothetical protein
MSNADPFIAAFHQWIDIFMHRSMRRFIHFARESGLSMSMIGTLFHLSKKGSAGVTDLGDHLGVTSAASSQMLERLVQQIQSDAGAFGAAGVNLAHRRSNRPTCKTNCFD